MQTNYVKLFPTKTKVPMLFYFETINQDDAQEISPKWEKDLFYQQILHKIKMEDEIYPNQKPNPKIKNNQRRYTKKEEMKSIKLVKMKYRSISAPVRIKKKRKHSNNVNLMNPKNEIKKIEIFSSLKFINLILDISKKKKSSKIENDYIAKLKNIIGYD